MRKFGNFVYTAGAFVVLAGAIVLITSRPASSTTGFSLVQVTNGIGNPVSVKDLNTPAQQPITFTLSPGSGVSSDAQDSYTVPAGKRLVIEYYSAQLTQYPSGGYAYMYLDNTAGGNTSYWKVIPPSSTTVPFNQQTRMYADTGTSVIAEVTQSSGTSCGGNLIVSGYLVNYP
jgi:hypothetical protein